MHSFVTSKNAQWRRLIWPTLYVAIYCEMFICVYHGVVCQKVQNSETPATEES